MPEITDHWPTFTDFARYELMSGGPDPQLATVAAMAGLANVNSEELIWRAGCYVSVYNVPGSEVLWYNWPYKEVIKEGTIPQDWLNEHWEHIPTRIERRCIRKPEWLSKFLEDYLLWMQNIPQSNNYEDWWGSVQQVKYMGRYVALKLLEFFHRYTDLNVPAVPDIRAKGGWSPVKTLSMLYPDIEFGKNVVMAEYAATRARTELINRLEDEDVSFFQLQVLLCEYRESYESRRQYPGRSLDSELTYWNKIKDYWREKTGLISDMPAARQMEFPVTNLGELRGWDGVRKELGTCLREYGYTWTDSLYNYNKLIDLATLTFEVSDEESTDEGF